MRRAAAVAAALVLPGKTHMGALEGLASHDDPGFRAVRAFLGRIVAAGGAAGRPPPGVPRELPREVRIRYPG